MLFFNSPDRAYHVLPDSGNVVCQISPFRRNLQPPSSSSLEHSVPPTLLNRSNRLGIIITHKTKIGFYVLLTAHLITFFANNQVDAQFFLVYLFIPILHMFRATRCSSSGESVVSIRPLVYVTLCR